VIFRAVAGNLILGVAVKSCVVRTACPLNYNVEENTGLFMLAVVLHRWIKKETNIVTSRV
jgi:hypothetical protein